MLVGRFDRPNLVYRVVPQVDRHEQTLEVLRRHAGEAAIVYCLSRKDTEAMAGFLRQAGLRAAHYHAGMEAAERRQTQDAFAQERLDVVVATVAFGMGIDRSNVRCVLHACHAQVDRALPAGDGPRRPRRPGGRVRAAVFGGRRAALGIADPQERREGRRARRGHRRPPAAPARRCSGLPAWPPAGTSSSRSISARRTQQPDCGACDVCLGEVEGIAEATVIAQKILSCVARVEQRFGVGHVADVLLGADTEMIRRCRHQQLSTYGLLKEHGKKEVQSWIYQLVDQGLVSRTDGDRPVLQLNEQSWAVLRGQLPVHLFRPKKGPRQRTRYDEHSWEGADRGLFDRLRQWRREAAARARRPAVHDPARQRVAAVGDRAADAPGNAAPGARHRRTTVGEPRTGVDRADRRLLPRARPDVRRRPAAVACSGTASPAAHAPRRQRKRRSPCSRKGTASNRSRETIGRARSTTVEYLEPVHRRATPRADRRLGR